MKRMLGIVLLGLTAVACATTPDDPARHTKQGAGAGAALGAIAGAIIGYQGDHSGGALKGALIGAAAGGALGAGVGRYMDRQQAEFEQRLASERDAHQVEIARLKDESLKITLNSEVSFDFDSAAIKPVFRPVLDKVAEILKRYRRTRIHVIGYTDNIGLAAYNQGLSERRAAAVARYLERRGVDSRRILSEGRGENEPRADNATAAGRQLNRRVEMLIVPDRNIG